MQVTLANQLSPYSNVISSSWAADRQLSFVSISPCYLLGAHYTFGVSLQKTKFRQLGYSTKLFQNTSGPFTLNFSYHPAQPADQIRHIRNSIQTHKTTCRPKHVKSSSGPLSNRGGNGLDNRPRVASVEQSSIVPFSATKSIRVRELYIFSFYGPA